MPRRDNALAKLVEDRPSTWWLVRAADSFVRTPDAFIRAADTFVRVADNELRIANDGDAHYSSTPLSASFPISRNSALIARSR